MLSKLLLKIKEIRIYCQVCFHIVFLLNDNKKNYRIIICNLSNALSIFYYVCTNM